MLLEVKNFSAEYPGFHLHPLSFSMEEGEILAVIGESGSGKTTLAKGLTCLLSEEAETFGEVIFKGRELLSMSEKERKPLRMQEFSMTFQNSAPYLNPSLTLYTQLREILDLKIPRKEQEPYMISLMEEVGLCKEDLSRYPRELSGGMAQRFLLGCAVALRPPLVVLDEPTNALDVHAAAEITALIGRLNKEHGTAFLVITHDMDLAAKISHRLMVLYEGHLMEEGETSAVLDRPRHPYTGGLIQASIRLNPVKDIWGIPVGTPNRVHCCPFYGRCTQSVEQCGQCAPVLETQSDGRKIACHRGGIVKILEGKGIGKSYGSQTVLKNCHIPVYSGEVVSLVGRSGAGKTTLANILGGFSLGSHQGTVEFEGLPADFTALHKAKGGIQMVFQDNDSAINPRLTVEEAVAEPLLLSGNGEYAAEGVRKALEDVGLPTGAFLKQKIRTLSGGQKQRVAIARALTMEPKLLIADEPTAMLDPSGCANILRLLKGMQNSRGFSMLIITHDLDSALKISDSIYLLKDGALERIRPGDYVQTNLGDLL